MSSKNHTCWVRPVEGLYRYRKEFHVVCSRCGLIDKAQTYSEAAARGSRHTEMPHR